MYSCTPKGNPNYTFRESIPLGVTSISTPQFRRSIEGLQDEWQGWTYDLLSRCDAQLLLRAKFQPALPDASLLSCTQELQPFL